MHENITYVIDRNKTYARCSVVAFILLFVMVVLTGCVADQQGGQVALPTTPEPTDAPQEMQTVADALMAYYAAHRSYPQELAQLRDANLISQQAFEAMPAYAYAGGGLGVLYDGRRVLLVDAVIRVPNRAWCIVIEPAGDGRAAVVQTALVSMAQLDAAAKHAR